MEPDPFRLRREFSTGGIDHLGEALTEARIARAREINPVDGGIWALLGNEPIFATNEDEIINAHLLANLPLLPHQLLPELPHQQLLNDTTDGPLPLTFDPGILTALPTGPNPINLIDGFFEVHRTTDTEVTVVRRFTFEDARIYITRTYLPTHFESARGFERLGNWPCWNVVQSILYYAIRISSTTSFSTTIDPEVLRMVVIEGRGFPEYMHRDLAQMRTEYPNLLEIMSDLAFGDHIQYRFA